MYETMERCQSRPANPLVDVHIAYLLNFYSGIAKH